MTLTPMMRTYKLLITTVYALVRNLNKRKKNETQFELNLNFLLQ